jgi:hypothetical protein
MQVSKELSKELRAGRDAGTHLEGRTLELAYKASRDGLSCLEFHKRCDYKGRRWCCAPRRTDCDAAASIHTVGQRECAPGGLTREVETPLPSNYPPGGGACQ